MVKYTTCSPTRNFSTAARATIYYWAPPLIIFGLPIVFNPYFLIPFVGVPVLAIILTYFAIAVGFLTPFAAVQVRWRTRPGIAGFLLGGWQGALVHFGTIVLSVACYFPFIRIQDKIYCAQEKQASHE